MNIDATALEEILSSCGDLLTESQEEALKAAIASADNSSRGVVDEGMVRCGDERYELDAYIWLRESTNEWVLELSGSINDCDFTVRHTEPLTTAPEDVASLPSLQAAALPAVPEVPEGESVTLRVAQIADLARFAGLILAQSPQPAPDELEAQITVCECPDAGVLLDGEDADPGVAAHYTHIAYYSEYPDEGCIGLGPEIAATPKDQP